MTMTQMVRPVSGAMSRRLGRDTQSRADDLQAVGGGSRLVVPAQHVTPTRPVSARPMVTQPVGAQPVVGRRAVARPPRALRCERSATGGLHGARLTRRGRVVVALLWAVLLGVAVPAALSLGASATGGYAGPTASVQIEPGDTLWNVATSLAPDDDPRVMINQIVDLNGLSSAGDISAGDLLEVPAQP